MRNFFTLFLVLTASVGTLFAESGTCGDNLTWDLTDGILTISGLGNMTDWDSYSVPWYSYRNNIASVTIGNSVTSIGNFAFSGCSDLTSVTIGNSVISIGEAAFQKCSSLTSVTIPNSVTSIENYAFSDCSGLASITIPNSVTSIGKAAFYECSCLTSVTIGNSVTSIGEYAFRYCSGMTSIEIPNCVTSIGRLAFSNCSGLTSMVVETGNPVYDSRDNCNAIIETLTNILIFGCKNTIIPNSITCIGESAFRFCFGLTNIEIPNSVTSIGGLAFRGCSDLTSITCKADVPPTCDGVMVFYNVDKSIPLYVPAGSVAVYAAADVWKDFSNIIGINSDNTAVDMISERHSARKIIRNGSLYIQSVNNEYTVSGQQIK